jgi:polysaccharide export outer membrane protein
MKKYLIPLIIMLSLNFTGVSFAQDYIVGKWDVLKISVYENDDLTTIVRVSDEGSIVVPLLGKLTVKELTVTKVAAKLSKLYADGYIIDPQVNVFVQEYRSKNAVILGQVQNPGIYELRQHTTFFELISKAGGLTKDAGYKATVKRQSDSSGQNIINIDIKKLIEKGETKLNIEIKDGDSIYISKAAVFYVTGEVKKPAAYKYDQEATVIKAITMAGGFTGKASKKGGKIIRTMDGKEVVMANVKMDEPVLPEDVIVIPESFF